MAKTIKIRLRGDSEKLFNELLNQDLTPQDIISRGLWMLEKSSLGQLIYIDNESRASELFLSPRQEELAGDTQARRFLDPMSTQKISESFRDNRVIWGSDAGVGMLIRDLYIEDVLSKEDLQRLADSLEIDSPVVWKIKEWLVDQSDLVPYRETILGQIYAAITTGIMRELIQIVLNNTDSGPKSEKEIA